MSHQAACTMCLGGKGLLTGERPEKKIIINYDSVIFTPLQVGFHADTQIKSNDDILLSNFMCSALCLLEHSWTVLCSVIGLKMTG